MFAPAPSLQNIKLVKVLFKKEPLPIVCQGHQHTPLPAQPPLFLIAPSYSFIEWIHAASGYTCHLERKATGKFIH